MKDPIDLAPHPFLASDTKKTELFYSTRWLKITFRELNEWKLSVLQLWSFASVWLLNNSVGSEPKLGSDWLGFGSSFWEKKAWLGSARHAFQKARLCSACHILQKMLGSARLVLSLKKPSYLEKQKMSWFPTFSPIFWGIILSSWRHQWKCVFFTKKLSSLKKST